MKYIIVSMLVSTLIIYAEKPENGSILQVKEECMNIRKELKDKIKTINENAKASIKRIRESFRSERKHCWKEHRGDIESIRSCILNNKQLILNKLEEKKSIQAKRFDDIIATIDTYKDKIKNCKSKREEFRKSRKAREGFIK